MLISKSRHHFLYNFIVPFLSFFVFKSVLLLGDERPNFVVILCDDLGYGDISCYGNKIIKTPNIDRLASQGIRFTDYYSPSPVCSPSRVGLLTGRTPNRAGIYDWIPSKTQFHLKEDEFTIPKMLKRVGYATCMSGKWHCNGMFNKNDQPQPGDFGFDHWFATQNNAAPSHKNPKNFVRNGKEVGELAGFSCRIVAAEANRWIESHVKESPDQPFFTFIAFHEPHEPISSPKSMIDNYPNAQKKGEALYYANVENMDFAVGMIMDCLAQNKVSENTLVIFTSDNGPETLNRYGGAWRSHGSPGDLRGMKLHTHEAGIRVPGIMRWPLQIKAGQLSDEPINSLDLMPTFANLAAGEIPIDLQIDGTDIVNAFGKDKVIRKRPMFWCYYSALNKSKIAIRDGNWKLLASLRSMDGKNIRVKSLNKNNYNLIKTAELVDFELYDIADDTNESLNLANKEPDELIRLSKIMRMMFDEVLEDSKIW